MSIIREIQRDAIAQTVSTSELLRRALFVARKLELKEFGQWVEWELKGYPSSRDLPTYRRIHGDLKAQHPFYGFVPCTIEDPELAELLSTYQMTQPVSEVESLVADAARAQHSQMVLSLGAGQMAFLRQHFDFNMDMPLMVLTSPARLESIVQATRNTLLEWALQLESDGIIGDGMTFSPEEKQMAASNHYHNSTIINGMTNSQLQQDSPGATQNQVNTGLQGQELNELLTGVSQWAQDSSLSPDEREELQADVETARAQLESPKPKIPILQAALHSVKTILEQAAASALASQAPDAAHIQTLLHTLSRGLL